MEFFLGLDLSASLSGITCPVMALNGAKDTQVQCDRNIAALKAGLPSNSRSVIRAEDGLNHLFQHCVTGEVSEYKNIEETFSPEVISRMRSPGSRLFDAPLREQKRLSCSRAPCDSPFFAEGGLSRFL